MLSGIGATAELERHGIATTLEQPMVGKNLQDHLAHDFLYRCKVPTINNQLHPWRGKIWQGIRYITTGSGLLALSVNQGGGFVRTNAQISCPNMQLYFSPASYTTATPGRRQLMNPDKFPGFLLGGQPTRPSSVGSLTIQSAAPAQPPRITPNYLSTDYDVQQMLEGVRYLRRLAAAPALRQIIDAELLPGANVTSEQALIDDIRKRSTTVFHPVSTCKMAADAAHGVVDSNLCVYGVDSLRIVDASVFPTLTSGNTNAPTIMLAEKAADIILKNTR